MVRSLMTLKPRWPIACIAPTSSMLRRPIHARMPRNGPDGAIQRFVANSAQYCHNRLRDFGRLGRYLEADFDDVEGGFDDAGDAAGDGARERVHQRPPHLRWLLLGGHRRRRGEEGGLVWLLGKKQFGTWGAATHRLVVRFSSRRAAVVAEAMLCCRFAFADVGATEEGKRMA
jgi:hypothetical protein